MKRQMKTLREFSFSGKRVLVRCDFNVPLGKQGEILDDFRIRQTLPTINYLLKNGAKLILMSHLGRPQEGQKHSLKLVAFKLEELLDRHVKFLEDCVGKIVEKEVKEMKEGEILFLENLRFHKEEEANDDGFARDLAKLGDIYINDAFGVSHRAHSSIVGVPKYLISGAGLLLEKEIRVLSNLMKNPKKPLVAIIGGKKVETKTRLIDKISSIADFVLISGLIRKEKEEKNIGAENSQKIIVPLDEIEKGKDIGPKTVSLFKEKIVLAKTVFWNGPLGEIEKKEFSKGTKAIAKAIAESSAFSIVGGGETVEFINKLGLISKFSHVSTGGGAMVSFLSGEELPGIKALNYGNQKS